MKKYSTEEKSKWLAAWKQSGERPWTFAKEQGLNPQTFSNWVEKETSNNSFVELKPAQRITSPDSSMVILEHGELRMKIRTPLSCEECDTIVQLWRALA